MRARTLYLHEWVVGGVALVNSLLLLILSPQLLRTPDGPRLIHRAIANYLGMAKIQIFSFIGVTAAALLLYPIPAVRRHLALETPRAIVAGLFRAAVPMLLITVFHQSTPLWQALLRRPEQDAALIRLDTWLFGGTNPTVWLQHIITKPLTDYMWAVYLAWFVAFQGTMYLLRALRPARPWADMTLGTMMTLVLGYVGYVLVPAVGPVHAMAASFTVSLDGSAIGAITNGVVDRFGVWRDAFPSIHAAVSMLLIIYAWRYLPRWRIPYTVLGVSILFSTVYLRWHYVVDVMAGMALSLFCAWLSPRLLAWHARLRPVSSPEPLAATERSRATSP